MSERIEAFWQDATADDVARVMAGETVEARFWDDEHRGKVLGSLVGWSRSEPCWCCEHCKQTGGRSYFENCQVYREPSWWINKPDPKPGYRLLGKFPDEELKPGDECFGVSGEWGPSCQANGGGHQVLGFWYRRRIEPAPKFAAGQMVRVIEPKATDARHWSEEMREHVGKASTIKAREKKDAGWFYELGCSAIWAFREDYIEPVEPVESKPVLIRRRVVEIGDEIKLPNGRVLVFNGEGFEVTQ
jgi:hypothetical protein